MGATSAARAQELLLSVAVSLKDATEELGREFQRTHPGAIIAASRHPALARWGFQPPLGASR